MLKRGLAVFLAFCMAFGLFAIGAVAETSAEDTRTLDPALADWEYTVDDDSETVVLNKYIGTSAQVEVPAGFTVGDSTYGTVLNSQKVFRANTVIRSVKLAEGVRFLNNSMRLLFGECSALTSADFSAVDTTEIVNMSYIFYNCTALRVFVFPSVETSKVTTIRGMFSGCSSLGSIDLTALKTPAVKDMAFMFYNCTGLRGLDLSSFDTSKAVTIRSMFSLCTHLSEIKGYESWNTSSVEDMYQTFNRVAYAVDSSTHVRIDLSRWDLSSLKNCGWIFQMCCAQEIIVPEDIPVMSAGFMNHAVRYAGTTYTVPAGVKKIGYAHTFYDFATNDFVEFKVAEGNENYKAVDGVLYSADGTEMLAVPRNKPYENGVFEIPEGVTFLGELSFSRNYNIHTVVLPDSFEIKYVPLNDERYIVFEDTGNLNAGTNLSVAVYFYTGITDYEVKETNPRYSSADGIVYSKDMTHVVAIPARYAKRMTIPEGVTCWDREAMWADGSDTGDNLLVNCSGASLPSTLTSMSEDQLDMLNRIIKKRANTKNPFTVTIAEGNKTFRLTEEGLLEYILPPEPTEETTEPTEETTETQPTVEPTQPQLKNGIVFEPNGDIRYYKDGVAQRAGLVRDEEGNYYYFNSSCKAVKDCIYAFNATMSNGLLPAGKYQFGADGKMIDPPVSTEATEAQPTEPHNPTESTEATEATVATQPQLKNGLVFEANGDIRFYKDGVAQRAGLVKDEDGNYYYINSTCKAVKNCTYAFNATMSNGLLPAGEYQFGADGKMIDLPVSAEATEAQPTGTQPTVEPTQPQLKNGLVFEPNGDIRYYKDGVAQRAGLVTDGEGNYYYINSTCKAVKNCVYAFSAAMSNGLLPKGGTYRFDEYGHMIFPE